MIGTGLFNPAVSAVALGSVPPEQSGLAAGVNDTFRQAGIAVGVAALGALVPAEAALGGGPAGLRRRAARRAVGRRRRSPPSGAVAAALLISRRFGASAEVPPAEEHAGFGALAGAARLDTARHARSVAIVLDGDRAA